MCKVGNVEYRTKSKKRENDEKEIDENQLKSKKEKRMEKQAEQQQSEEQAIHSNFDKELEESILVIFIE